MKVEKADERRYLAVLRAIALDRSTVDSRGEEVWWEDVLEGVQAVQEEVREVQGVAGVLRGLNSAVAAGDRLGGWSYLSNNSSVLAIRPPRSPHPLGPWSWDPLLSRR